MGIKKIARPMNRAKNAFVKWLKEKGADNLSYDNSNLSDEYWDYYANVSGFVNDKLHLCVFMVWKGEEKISLSNEDHYAYNLSIKQFTELLNQEI